jgi:hypothetical protein
MLNMHTHVPLGGVPAGGPLVARRRRAIRDEHRRGETQPPRNENEVGAHQGSCSMWRGRR